jgi:energy-converting hydrogenase Eha subunit H
MKENNADKIKVPLNTKEKVFGMGGLALFAIGLISIHVLYELKEFTLLCPAELVILMGMTVASAAAFAYKMRVSEIRGKQSH